MVSSITNLRTSALDKAESTRIESNTAKGIRRAMFTLQQSCCPYVSQFRRRDCCFTIGGNIRPPWKASVTSNQTRAPLVSEIGPGPLDENYQAVAKSDQKENMYEEPGQPSEVA